MPLTERLRTAGRFDLLVIGGGVHGLFAAYDAAQRGLSVALVERSDFASELSFNHQRTVHGGLRALERFAFGTVRAQLAERATWARIAPHYLDVLPFLTATSQSLIRSRLALQTGFLAYRLLAGTVNTAASDRLRLPPPRLAALPEARELFPGISASGLTGAAIWYKSSQARHPDRLNWLLASAAIQAGALVENYVEAVSLLKRHDRIVGAELRDVGTGDRTSVEAHMTLVAAGAGLGSILHSANLPGAPPLLAASNVLLNRAPGACAWAAKGRSGRMLTAVPWLGRLLVGTFQSEQAAPPGTQPPQGDEVERMVDDANGAFPGLDAGLSDVLLVHHGLTPARVEGDRADLLPESLILGHRDHGVNGIFSIAGAKFTTARRTAEEAVDRVCEALGRNRRSRTATTPLPHAAETGREPHDAARNEAARRDDVLDPDVEAHLTDWYGGERDAVLAYCRSHGLVDRLSPDTPVLAGEIAYAAEHARAERLSDVVLRRTRLGSIGHPGAEALQRAANVMGRLRGWTAERVAREIDEVEARFARFAPVERAAAPADRAATAR